MWNEAIHATEIVIPIECPLCGAPRTIPCLSINGNPLKFPHSQRKVAYCRKYGHNWRTPTEKSREITRRANESAQRAHDLYEQHGTLAAAGELLGISRERVRQLNLRWQRDQGPPYFGA